MSEIRVATSRYDPGPNPKIYEARYKTEKGIIESKRFPAGSREKALRRFAETTPNAEFIELLKLEAKAEVVKTVKIKRV